MFYYTMTLLNYKHWFVMTENLASDSYGMSAGADSCGMSAGADSCGMSAVAD